MYFGRGQYLKLTTEVSEKVQYSRNQANQKQLKWSNTAYVNKWSLTFKIKLTGNQDFTLYEGDSNF